VVRLSDWLAPDDELVPFGPRAHTATTEPAERRADSDAEPPAAAGFWDGDTSMHTAVPGPDILDESGDRDVERGRYRRFAPIRRLALPPLDPFGWGQRAREAIADLVDWISWPWAAGGLAFVSLVIVGLLATLGGSSGHREMAAQAGVGDQSGATLNVTVGEIGTATRAAAVADLRSLPPVDTAGRTIGAAAQGALALRAHDRRHALVASSSASDPAASTTGSVDTTTTTLAPTETSPEPTETEPVQTTPTSGGGASSSGGGSSSSSSSQKQPAFGATGSLGPGSSPDG